VTSIVVHRDGVALSLGPRVRRASLDNL